MDDTFLLKYFVIVVPAVLYFPEERIPVEAAFARLTIFGRCNVGSFRSKDLFVVGMLLFSLTY